MPLLSEIARISGGRIITKDGSGDIHCPICGLVYGPGETKKEFMAHLKKEAESSNLREQDKKELYDIYSKVHASSDSKDSALSTLTDLAKNLGESLMEPTEKAAAGDTKDDWSEEARRKAIEARRRNAMGKKPAGNKPVGANTAVTKK